MALEIRNGGFSLLIIQAEITVTFTVTKALLGTSC